MKDKKVITVDSSTGEISEYSSPSNLLESRKELKSPIVYSILNDGFENRTHHGLHIIYTSDKDADKRVKELSEQIKNGEYKNTRTARRGRNKG